MTTWQAGMDESFALTAGGNVVTESVILTVVTLASSGGRRRHIRSRRSVDNGRGEDGGAECFAKGERGSAGRSAECVQTDERSVLVEGRWSGREVALHELLESGLAV